MSDTCSQQKLTVLEDAEIEAAITAPLELLRPQSKLLQSCDFNLPRVMCKSCWCNKSRIILIFPLKFNTFLFNIQQCSRERRASKRHYTNNVKAPVWWMCYRKNLHCLFSSHTWQQHDGYLDSGSLQSNFMHFYLLYNKNKWRCRI